jgi:GAF domain-containing protein
VPPFPQTLEAETDPGRLLQLTLRHFNAETGTIHVLGGDGLLYLRAVAGSMPPPVLDAIRIIPPGKGIAGLAFERREPVDMCNLQTDSTGAARPAAATTGVKGLICVPMMVDGDAVGALGVGTSRERAFTPAEIDLLLEAARVVGRKLWNS